MTTHIQQAANLNPKYLIEVTQKGEIYTDSLKVAAAFGREHKNVLQSINRVECSESFVSANFLADTVNIGLGAGRSRKSKIYRMTKDGFIFLVMGFTGKKAAQVKEAYINAFNQMYIELYGEPAQRMPRPIEFRGHKVLQLKQIDQLHGRLPNHSQTRFYEKKDQMQEGFDYFRVKPEDKQLLLDQGFHQYRRNMILITSNGYKKLTKPYTEPNSHETRKRVLEGYYIQANEYQFKESDKANAEAYQALDLLRRWGRIRKIPEGTERTTCFIQWGELVSQFLDGKPLADAQPVDDMGRYIEADRILMDIIRNDADRKQNDFTYAQRNCELWVQRTAWAKRWGILKRGSKAAGQALGRSLDACTIETAILRAKTLVKLASPIDTNKALAPDDLSHVMSLVTDLLEKVETELHGHCTH